MVPDQSENGILLNPLRLRIQGNPKVCHWKFTKFTISLPFHSIRAPSYIYIYIYIALHFQAELNGASPMCKVTHMSGWLFSSWTDYIT